MCVGGCFCFSGVCRYVDNIILIGLIDLDGDRTVFRSVKNRGNRAAQNRRRMAEEDGDEAYFNESDDDEDENQGPQPAEGASAVVAVGGDPHEANGGGEGGTAGGCCRGGRGGAGTCLLLRVNFRSLCTFKSTASTACSDKDGASAGTVGIRPGGRGFSPPLSLPPAKQTFEPTHKQLCSNPKHMTRKMQA